MTLGYDAAGLTTQYGVLVFRKTGLDDESHIALSRMLGELDDMGPYVAKGRKLRLGHIECVRECGGVGRTLGGKVVGEADCQAL